MKNLQQEEIPVVKEDNTAQYAWCRDDTELYTWWTETKEDKKHDYERWIFCILSEKEERYPIEAMDYSAIIEMNRRISMQMITPVSTWHYDSHLENNDGKWDDNVKNIKQK